MAYIVAAATGIGQLCWAVRSNRKFTGHEDDGTADSNMYCIQPRPAAAAPAPAGLPFLPPLCLDFSFC